MDCLDWNEQFELLSKSGFHGASNSEWKESSQNPPPTPVPTPGDIYRGLFMGGEEEEEETVDELYMTAMGLDEGKQEHGDSAEKKDQQEIFFRKPY